MRSGLHPLVADAIVGHGDREKDVKSVYLTISDADLVREIDRLTFDHGKTEIWGQSHWRSLDFRNELATVATRKRIAADRRTT